MNTIIKKVWMDIFRNKTKTALIMLTLFVGSMAVGVVVMFSSFFISESNRALQSANPCDAMIRSSDFSPEILNEIKQIPGVEDVNARKSLKGQIQVENEKINTDIIALDGSNTIDIIRKSDGKSGIPALGKGEVFIERCAIKDLNKKAGDTVTFYIEDKQFELKIREYVYDAVTEPYTIEGDMVAFINRDTLQMITGGNQFDEVRIRVSGENKSKGNNTDVAQKVAALMESGKITINEIEVPEPGTYYATNALRAVKLIMLLIGVLSIIMGVALIINIINSFMLQHVRQIGIMKAIGGNTAQISLMYIGMVLAISFAVFVVSLPVSSFVGYMVCNVIAALMNISLSGFRIPLILVLIQILGTVIIPVAASFIPIMKSTKASVYDALNNNLKGASFKNIAIIDFISRKWEVSPISLISFRNTFRNKLRMLLTLGSLTLAGTIFIAGINLQKSFSNTVEESKYLIQDGILTLDTFQNADKLREIAQQVEGVETAESWGFYPGQFVEMSTGNSKKVRLMAPPPDSAMFDKNLVASKLMEGRVIEDDSKNEILITTHLTEIYPEVGVGDMVRIKINGKLKDLKVVGIVDFFGRPSDPVLIVGYSYLNSLLAGKDMVIDLRIMTKEHTAEYQSKVCSEIDKELQKNKISVLEINLGEDMLEQFSTSTTIVIMLLMFLAVMIGIIGSIGLSGTLGLNILERLREIGIMRSVGATNPKLNRMIILEGIILAIAAWIIGLILSIPLTLVAGKLLGEALMGVGAGFSFNLTGTLAWLAISVIAAYIAGRLPCRKVNRMVTREVFSYE